MSEEKERDGIFLIAFCIAPASTGVGRDRYYGAGYSGSSLTNDPNPQIHHLKTFTIFSNTHKQTKDNNHITNVLSSPP
jgi:hypothetical protein